MIKGSLVKQTAARVGHLWGEIRKDHCDQNFRICSDSREVQYGDIFMALKGDGFDGMQFLEQVLRKGSQIVIFTMNQNNLRTLRRIQKSFPNVSFLGVKDTVYFLQELARTRLEAWRDPRKVVIGITGSNGKTTVKELLYLLLDKVFPGEILATYQNLNNHIGVPLTLLRLENDHRYLILEMGSNHPGEIQFLCDLISPNAGLITNIGDAHLEFFNNCETIFREKSALYYAVKKHDGIFVINVRDPYLKTLKIFKGSLYCHALETVKKNHYIEESFNYENLDMAFCMADALCLDKKKELQKAVLEVKLPSMNRSEWINREGRLYFADAYNANPSSMKRSLMAFIEKVSQKEKWRESTLFILGDMQEIGRRTEEFHRLIGSILLQEKITSAIFVGECASFYNKGFKGYGREYGEIDEFRRDFKKIVETFRYIFLKGSHSLQLKRSLDMLSF